MAVVVAILLVLAVILAALESIGTSARISLGWLAVAALSAALAVPAVAVAT